MNLFTATLKRDLRGALRRKGQLLPAPAFFVMAAALFPLGAGPDPQLLERAGAGLLAIAALLAALLPLDSLFRADREDGTLDLLVLSPAPLSLYAAGRIAAHWLLTALPLAILSPVMALALNLTPATAAAAPFIILPLTALLCLMGAPCAALTLSARGGGVLLAFLVLPLYIPVLIFGAGALDLVRDGGGLLTTPFLLLLAMLALAIPVVPLAVAAILEEQI